MKLLSIISAKSIWLFPTIDLNPHGASYPGLLDALRDRYQFQLAPTADQLVQRLAKKEAIQFGMGTFDSAHGRIEVALTYYADGIMAETRAGTPVSDQVLTDLLTWLTATYSTTPENQIKIRKIYASELSVSYDHSLNFLNPQLSNLAGSFGAKANWPNPGLAFEVTGVTFAADPRSKSQHPPFRIERDGAAPFEDDRYWSAAPLQTEDHVTLLQQLEASLKSNV